MNDLITKQRDFEARIDAAIAERKRRWAGRPPAHPAPPPTLPHLDTSGRLSPHAFKVDLGSTSAIQAIDDLFRRDFDLARRLPAENLAYPTVYCETLEEFFTPLLEAEELSPTIRQAELARLVQEAQEVAAASGGKQGVFGVNLPGRGCYLNGWLFAYGTEQPPRAVLGDPHALPRIVGTAAHEKLGHGFLTVYSALGAEKRQLHLDRYERARRFGLRTTDSPQGHLLRQKGAVVFHASKLTEEGWSQWIEGYVLDRVCVPTPDGDCVSMSAQRWDTDRLQAALAELAVRSQYHALQPHFEAVQEAWPVLLTAPDPSPEDLFKATVVLQHAEAALAEAGVNFVRYAVGELLARQLEEAVGTRCVPYAALIAANLTYDLDRISLADLERLVVREPALNVDARLALLAHLVLPARDDVAVLAQAAREALNLAVPAGW